MSSSGPDEISGRLKVGCQVFHRGPWDNSCDGDVPQGIETEIGLKVGGLGSGLRAGWERPILNTYTMWGPQSIAKLVYNYNN